MTFSCFLCFQDETCRQLRVTSLKEMINHLDESGRLPFAYDEKEKVYKAIQATQVFASPVKQNKEFDDEEVDDVSLSLLPAHDFKTMFLKCFFQGFGRFIKVDFMLF